MTMLEAICKTVAMENNSQCPCSLCPIPHLRLVGVMTSHIYLLDTLSSGPHYKSLFGGPWLHPVTIILFFLFCHLSPSDALCILLNFEYYLSPRLEYKLHESREFSLCCSLLNYQGLEHCLKQSGYSVSI